MAGAEYQVMIDPLPAAEGGGYAAVVPDLPGCMADGETREAAAHNVQDAIACWIEAAQELQRPIPTPSPQRAFA